MSEPLDGSQTTLAAAGSGELESTRALRNAAYRASARSRLAELAAEVERKTRLLAACDFNAEHFATVERVLAAKGGSA